MIQLNVLRKWQILMNLLRRQLSSLLKMFRQLLGKHLISLRCRMAAQVQLIVTIYARSSSMLEGRQMKLRPKKT